MIVEHIWTGNDYRNFHYLITCSETGESLAVDPLDYEECLARAKANGWEITQILNTHEHRDHIGGNRPMIEATGAKLLAHWNADSQIKGIDRGLRAGDRVQVGKTVELLALDTPGHTLSHICLLSKTDPPALFSGDTLFAAGAGRCHHGGDPQQLFESFDTQLSALADETLVYPGHDYLAKNLDFTLDREPDNQRAAALLEELVESGHPEVPLVTTMALERQINTFCRLSSKTVIHKLREAFVELPKMPTAKDVFLRLRELRNQW